jgi:hypothetical protein
LLILAAGLVIGLLAGKFLRFPRAPVEQRIKEFYELVIPGVAADVLSLEEESGLYHAVVRIVAPDGVSYREIYVSKDGKLLTETMIYVERSIEQIRRMKSFVECLDGKGVRIYGWSNQTATILQLQLLGRYSPLLFVSCDGQLVQRCIEVGVTEIPSVVMDRRVEPGLKTLDWFAKETGCEL